VIYTKACDIVKGSTLGDMHYGIANIKLDVEHRVVSTITWAGSASELIEGITGRTPYTNKMLVVVDPCNRRGNVVAMWGYDGTTIGVVELEVKR